MTNRLRNQLLITVLLAVFLTVSTGAQVHAAKISLTKSGVSTQTAPKPTAGPYQGEPDSQGSGLPLPPKEGNYPTVGGRLIDSPWIVALRNLLLSLVGRLGR
ncbi:MAG: hypothetical protein K8R56_08540 [Candidatus Eisenbacteria bacterium]|nr:hypothetical protein [Candidatus Eisenbacteria bacterium]